MFRGSSTQLYIPAFTQKDFKSTSLSTKDSHKGNLHRGFGAIQSQGVPNSSPYKHNLLLEAQHQANKQSPHNLRDKHKTTQGSPHHLRDTTQMHNLLNTMRERHKAKQRLGLQLGDQKITNNLFSHTKIL